MAVHWITLRHLGSDPRGRRSNFLNTSLIKQLRKSSNPSCFPEELTPWKDEATCRGKLKQQTVKVSKKNCFKLLTFFDSEIHDKQFGIGLTRLAADDGFCRKGFSIRLKRSDVPMDWPRGPKTHLWFLMLTPPCRKGLAQPNESAGNKFIWNAWSYWLAAVLRKKHTGPLASTCHRAMLLHCHSNKGQAVWETVSMTDIFQAWGFFVDQSFVGKNNLRNYCWDIGWDEK